MERKKYNQFRAVVTLFVGMIVGISVVQGSYWLSIIGVLTGMVFMTLVRSKAKIRMDEREVVVRQKAAQLTYAIFAPTIGLGAFLLLMISNNNLQVMANGEFAYLESLGMILAYLALFMISLYAISFYYINRQYGGGDEE